MHNKIKFIIGAIFIPILLSGCNEIDNEGVSLISTYSEEISTSGTTKCETTTPIVSRSLIPTDITSITTTTGNCVESSEIISDEIVEESIYLNSCADLIEFESVCTTYLEEENTMTGEITYVTYITEDSTYIVQTTTYAYEETTQIYSTITEDERILLCNLVGREYGSDYVPVSEKAKVVATVMNRVKSPDFPDTIYGVVTQKGQFTGYVPYSYYTDKVTESVKESVEYYFSHSDEFGNYLYFYGDGKWNYFS